MLTKLAALFISVQVGAFALWSDHPFINNAVCKFASNQQPVKLVSEHAGGAIITGNGKARTYNIYAQPVNASGVLQWTTNGEVIIELLMNKPALRYMYEVSITKNSLK